MEFKDEIHIKLPEGIECYENLVCNFNKVLFELKQAPRTRNHVFDEFVNSRGSGNSNKNFCSGTYRKNNVYWLVYVDDVLFARSKQ